MTHTKVVFTSSFARVENKLAQKRQLVTFTSLRRSSLIQNGAARPIRSSSTRNRCGIGPAVSLHVRVERIFACSNDGCLSISVSSASRDWLCTPSRMRSAVVGEGGSPASAWQERWDLWIIAEGPLALSPLSDAASA